MKMTLKAARVNAGLTQAQAAKALGISKSTLINYEKYKTTPDIALAQKIATLYGVAIDNIIFLQTDCA